VEHFAGLDVSLEEAAICIIDNTGMIVYETGTASESEALIAFSRASGMEMKRVGFEACSLTAWLHQTLPEAGIAAICIETCQAKAAMDVMPNKTDRNDTPGISQLMRAGWYRAAHVKNACRRSWVHC
jgi:transposase